MSSFAVYTDKNIYGFFKPEEICFAVKTYDCAVARRDITDDLEQAKDLAKTYNKEIYICKKSYVKDYFDADELFRDLTDILEYKGIDTDELLNYTISDKQITDFKDLTKKWFNDAVKDSWIATTVIGILKSEDETIPDLKDATFDPKDVFTCVTCHDAEQYLGKEGYFSNIFATDIRWWSKGILKEVHEYSHTSNAFLMFDKKDLKINAKFKEFGLFLPADKVKLGE